MTTNDNNETTMSEKEKTTMSEKEKIMSVREKVRKFIYEYVDIAGRADPGEDDEVIHSLIKANNPEIEWRSENEGYRFTSTRMVDNSGENPVIYIGYAGRNAHSTRATGIIMKMQRKKNNKGWVIFFTLVGNTRNGVTKTYVKELDDIFLTVNETNNGVKLLWFINKKPHWGVEGASRGFLYGFDGIIWIDIAKEIENIYPIDKFIPIAKYLSVEENLIEYDTNYIWGLSRYQLNNFSRGTNIKDILNRIYGKSGQLGLTKNAFGGLNKIITLNQLVRAGSIVRLFRNFPASFFEKMDKTFLHDFECFTHYWLKRHLKGVDYFTKYFNRPKIQEEIFEYFNKFDPQITTGQISRFDAFHRMSQYIGLISDSGYMLRRIRNRTVRNNIFAFRGSVQEIHDLIIVEYNKIKEANQTFKHSKDVKALNGQRVTNTIECVIPKDTHTLVEWGSVQSNCIGSYGDRVMDKSSLIIGFKSTETNQWIGHAEIVKDNNNGWSYITQLLGKHNAPLTQSDDSVIRAFINDWMKDQS
jgi:hypothetical protein